MFRSFCLAATLLCLMPRLAPAAQMDVRQSASGSWIFVHGPLLLEDGARFQRILAATADAAVVALESDGGRLVAGLDIGNAIRARQLSTVVLEATQCASACAIAWLGGSRRYMGTNARIGFHAAYLAEGRRAGSESGVGNAVLGAYLSRLGLSDRAVIHITQAAPNQMTWLTLRDARALDIDVLPFTSAGAAQITAAAPSRSASAQAQVSLEQAARQFPFSHYAQAAQVGIVADDYLRGAYAEEVSVGGTNVPRERLLAARHRLGERWPEQAYTVRPETVQVKCSQVSPLCDVTGVVDWEWSSWGRGARSSGSANFTFQITFDGATAVIRGENEAVFARQGSGPQ